MRLGNQEDTRTAIATTVEEYGPSVARVGWMADHAADLLLEAARVRAMSNHTSLLRGDGLRSEASSEGFGTNDAARSQPARVLLIDDDHAIRQMVGTYLA